MRIVRPGDSGYDKDRVISNARFDYRPSAIYYCANAQDVKKAIAAAGTNGVRIRSGGHQHEGMCSANGVLLIDVSSINSFQFLAGNPGRVWIGAGAALADVYVELWRRGYYFPGGACGDVHVGGLTQGGGWGFGLRQYGLTCDSLIGAEIVTAGGDIYRIPRPGYPEDQKLLQALRGGGGGNFGVITRFCFRLHPMTYGYVDVSVTWGDAQLPGDSLDQLLKRWMSVFPRDQDHRLTTFMRLLVAPSGTNDRLLLSGRYLGSIPNAQRTLDRLLKGQAPPREIKYTLSPFRPKRKGALRLDPREREQLRKHLGTHPGYQPGPTLSGAAAGGSPDDLTSTCGGISLRHKISSGFVRRQVNPNLVPALTSVIRKTTPLPSDVARQYVSLHCLGGAAFDERLPGAYAFRDRAVLLQYQAWWQPDDPRHDPQCIAWIEKFRKTMAPYTDGAFINFVDRDIPLAEYYKDKLPQLLVGVKQQWDPHDFFKFEMSIPLG
jgi:FAD binding domain-containing protein/berberine-like enzyme